MWLNDPQFKSETPNKWVVRTKETDPDGDHWYVVNKENWLYTISYPVFEGAIVKFDTKEEAEEYCTPQCEVVEVEE